VDGRRSIGIIVTTLYVETVDPILVHGMARTDDGAVPFAHHDIVSIFQSVRTRTVANALFALFEFFEESEVARDFGWH